MVGVAVGNRRPQLNIDAVLGEEELVVLLVPESAEIVLVENGGMSDSTPVSLSQ